MIRTLIKSATAVCLGVFVATTAFAGEDPESNQSQGQVGHPGRQMTQPPSYNRGGGGPPPYAEGQYYRNRTYVYQNPGYPAVGQGRYFVPGIGLPQQFQCVRCIINYLGANFQFAQVVAFDQWNRPFALTGEPISVGPRQAYLISFINSVKEQTGWCTNLPFRRVPLWATVEQPNCGDRCGPGLGNGPGYGPGGAPPIAVPYEYGPAGGGGGPAYYGR